MTSPYTIGFNNQTPIIEDYIPVEVRELVEKLARSYEVTDNNQKIDMLTPVFESHGFENCGSGTNRTVFVSQKNSSIVFKIALDERGYDDNVAEYNLSSSNILANHITIMHETDGYIGVADRAYTFTSDDFNDNIETIYKILQMISAHYLLDDVGPESFLNWGYSQSNDVVILDYAYFVPTKGIDFTCQVPNCDGNIVYTEDYRHMLCTNCRRKYTLSDVYHGRDTSMEVFEGLNVSVGDEPETNRFDGTSDYMHATEFDRAYSAVSSIPYRSVEEIETSYPTEDSYHTEASDNQAVLDNEREQYGDEVMDVLSNNPLTTSLYDEFMGDDNNSSDEQQPIEDQIEDDLDAMKDEEAQQYMNPTPSTYTLGSTLNEETINRIRGIATEKAEQIQQNLDDRSKYEEPPTRVNGVVVTPGPGGTVNMGTVTTAQVVEQQRPAQQQPTEQRQSQPPQQRVQQQQPVKQTSSNDDDFWSW